MRRLAAALLLLPLLASAQSLEGVWRGRILSRQQQPLSFELLFSAPGSTPAGRLQPVGHGAVAPFFIDTATLSPEGDVRIEIQSLRVLIEGKLAADTGTLAAAWTQFGTDRQPLQLTRASSPTPPTFFDPPVEIRIPKPPTAVLIDGSHRIFYEINVANHTEARIELQSVDIQVGERTVTLSGPALARQTISYGVSIPPNKSGLVLMALGMSSMPPEVLRHRVTFTSAGKVHTLSTQSTPVARDPVRIAPPLRGNNWWAGNGPDSSLHHRSAIVPMDGRFTLAQRFAFDFSKRIPGSNDFERGDLRQLTSSPSYGAQVLAVADATVASVRDGVPDTPPYEIASPVPITKDTLGGNLIVLDLGQNRWAVYAHLQPGSLHVKAGDRVRKGDPIARLGNSASYSAHLHFQIVDGPDPFSSEGIPFVFDEFTHNGTTHRNEMPSGGWTIGFPAARTP